MLRFGDAPTLGGSAACLVDTHEAKQGIGPDAGMGKIDSLQTRRKAVEIPTPPGLAGGDILPTDFVARMGTMDQLKTDLSTLTDAALAEAASRHRREAAHGNRQSFGVAHEYERELRRRAGVVATHDVAMSPFAIQTSKPWWRAWVRPRSERVHALRT